MTYIFADWTTNYWECRFDQEQDMITLQRLEKNIKILWAVYNIEQYSFSEILFLC